MIYGTKTVVKWNPRQTDQISGHQTGGMKTSERSQESIGKTLHKIVACGNSTKHLPELET